MTRDPNVLRSVLLAVEQSAPIHSQRLTVPDVDPKTANYHLHLLMQAGYVDARDEGTLKSFAAQVMGLTWRGHEFVEAVRDQPVWDALVKELKLDARSVPFSVIEGFAIMCQRSAAGLDASQRETPEHLEEQPMT